MSLWGVDAPEQVPDDAPKAGPYHLTLYGAGQTAKSLAAAADLRRVCVEYLPGRYDIEIINLPADSLPFVADRSCRMLIERVRDAVVTLNEDGAILYANRRFAAMLGLPHDRVQGQPFATFVLPEQRPGLDRLFDEAGRALAHGTLLLRGADGTPLPVNVSLGPVHAAEGGMLLGGVLADQTERQRRERDLAEAKSRLAEVMAERERGEEALRQSQKMQAVGQLTGGLAHDFNNLLTGIAGSLELLQARVAQGRVHDLDRYVDTARGAAKRAAALTRRLLAFSRRETLDPKPTDVNRLVAGMEELIRRTVGPEITVEPVAAAGLWTTLVDPGQLENALLNLCINARDAMPSGGRLTIETANQRLDARAARERDLSPGQYVTLCVSDNGSGMSPDIVDRVFDPFFTTKPTGTGTGLGLSMVDGFVRQSGGQARICSERGRGTTVRLYLPRHFGQAEAADLPPASPEIPQAAGGETVLVVDDEPTVRMLVAEVLEDLGYTTIETADGSAGLRVLQGDARIDLLVTDVGLPGGMNGRQVADAARALRPGLKVLFITGYAENAVLSHGHLEPGMHVLTKPFAMDVLASRIRELIDGE